MVSFSREKDTSSDLSIQIKNDYLDVYESRFSRTYLTCNPGDLILMHPYLLHASSDNFSNESRDLMITVYNRIDNLPTLKNRPNYLCEPYRGEIDQQIV